jgi:hypothetical protein
MAVEEDDDVFSPTPMGTLDVVMTLPENAPGSFPAPLIARRTVSTARLDSEGLPLTETSHSPGEFSISTSASVVSLTLAVAPLPLAIAFTMLIAPKVVALALSLVISRPDLPSRPSSLL